MSNTVSQVSSPKGIGSQIVWTLCPNSSEIKDLALVSAATNLGFLYGPGKN